MAYTAVGIDDPGRQLEEEARGEYAAALSWRSDFLDWSLVMRWEFVRFRR